MTTPREIIEKLKQEEAAVQPKKFSGVEDASDWRYWSSGGVPVRYDFYSPMIVSYGNLAYRPSHSVKYTQT